MEEFVLKVGPLNSLNSLYSFLGPTLGEVRNRFMHGQFTEIKFDLRGLIYQKINISALTAFLSTSRKIRQVTGQPIGLILKWDPHVLAFLTDIGFFEISKTLDIFWWDERIVGGFKRGVTNPNTKLVYFADQQSMSQSDILNSKELIEYKSFLKQKISPNFVLRCSEILRNFTPNLRNTITNSAIELIVNSLVHGQDIAIVGLQRSSKRITICVSDAGIGFKKSIIKTFGNDLSQIDHAQAIIIGSLVQKEEHGLRLAIEEVLNFEITQTPEELLLDEGSITISSFDTEVKWQKPNWAMAKSSFDDLSNFVDFKGCEVFLGQPIQKLDSFNAKMGYWKTHQIPLIGTRVTFDLPL